MTKKYAFTIFTVVFIALLTVIFCLGYFRDNESIESGKQGEKPGCCSVGGVCK